MPQPGKYGRTPVRRTVATRRSLDTLSRALAGLGAPPSVSSDWIAAVTAQAPAGWGMLGNDTYGDCVEACEGHLLMLRTANAGPAILVPTEAQILALYSAETGFIQGNEATDLGTNETLDAEYMVSTGLLGHQAQATAMVAPADLDHVKWCVELFGACVLGFNVPRYAENQFAAGQPWDLDPAGDQTIVGGHCVPIVGYDGTYLYTVTWGQVQKMTPAFFLGATTATAAQDPVTIVDEAHVTLWPDWIEAKGAAPSGLNLTQLAAELAAVDSVLTVNFSQSLALEIAFLDAGGAIVSATPDAPPQWSNSAPAVETVTVSADGMSATTRNKLAGNDAISVSLTLGGVAFTAPALAVAVAESAA